MKNGQEQGRTFEASLEALEQIVRQLESGDLPLEKSLELFEQGIRLSRECQERLSQAERRIEILLRDNQGRPVVAHLLNPLKTTPTAIPKSVFQNSLVEVELNNLLPASSAMPEKVHQAIRWSMFAGGKRFRPALLIATGEAFGAPIHTLIKTADRKSVV